MKFHHLYNSRAGETCVIIGNGPSLRDVPDSWLDLYPTFGANRIYLKYPKPTYYVAVNPLVIEQCKGEITFVVQSDKKFIRENTGFDMEYELHSVNVPMFSYNPCDWLYEGYTVTFASLVLAFFMGFDTALLVGVDHRFKYDVEPNEETTLTGEDPNHFDPSYFKGMRWNAPDLEQSEWAYKLAKEAYENNGRQIINLTPNSALDVFHKAEPEWVP